MSGTAPAAPPEPAAPAEAAATSTPAAPARAEKLLLWGGLAAALAAALAGGLLARREPLPPLPVLGQLPDFELVAAGGGPRGSRELRGRPWVADFVFTRCGGICPVLSAGFARLERETRARGLDAVRLVSFTVDPAHDTPEVLGAYARARGADPERWWFLTGERAALHRLVGEGFRLSVAEAPPGAAVDPAELVTHSDRLVLVDGSLRVRGTYHGTEPGAVEAVLADLERLVREEPGRATAGGAGDGRGR